jgi:hypothetical protein
MSMTYTYEIISVDQAARCMEVVYTSEGNPTMHIGARLPYEGETVEAVVEMYAPVRYWEELKTPVVPVTPGQTGSVVVPPPYVPTPAKQAISKRDALLSESDWTQLPDVPLTTEQKSEWAVYRQALRDITDQPGFPDNINWPVKPGIPVTVA